MNKQMIEAMAQERGWVVKYAADGTPSFFYPIYKCTSKSLDPSLPDRTHPAFIVNGQEIDRVLVGVYKGSEHNGAIHSLPMQEPRHSLGHDELRNLCLAAGPGFTGKTVAISGLLLLMAKKYGWNPKGNNYYGVDHRDGTPWLLATNLTSGAKRVYQGWEYTCNANHMTALENAPPLRPDLWQKGRFIGGVPVPQSITNAYPNGLNTMTGSGPVSWALGGTVNGITDLNGNCSDQDYGFRVFNGELQILANNDALHPDADLSPTSLAWKAILPNSGNDGHTLVAPGTAGTLKWDATGVLTGGYYVPRLDTVISKRCVGEEYLHVIFNNLTANSANLPYVPAIVKELGLFPVAGSAVDGRIYYRNQEATEYVSRRGGRWSSTSLAGLACSGGHASRGFSGTSYGVRSAFLETL